MDGILLPIQPKSSDLFPPWWDLRNPRKSWWPNRSPWLLVAGFREENGWSSVVRKGVNLVSRQGTPAVQVILNQTPLEGPMILRVGRLQGFYDESCVFLIDTYIETVHQCSISSINLDVSCLRRIYFREIYKGHLPTKGMGAQPGTPGLGLGLRWVGLLGFPACSRWQLSLRLAVGSPPFRVEELVGWLVVWLFSQFNWLRGPATSCNLRIFLWMKFWWKNGQLQKKRGLYINILDILKIA